MAQTVDDITNEMLDEKATHPELDALNSDSNTAIWRLWMFIVASVIMFFEEIMDAFKVDIQTIIDSNQYGTDSWWYNKMMAFQYGDLLVFMNNVFQYATIDTSKQIIGFCSVNTLNGIVQIKLATNNNGQPAVLSDKQLDGAISYVSKIQPSGIRWAVLSLPPDLIWFIGNIYYDASGDITIIQPAVEAALQSFLSNLNTVQQDASGVPISENFNGTLFLNEWIDAIQKVPGVVGPQVDGINLSAKNDGGEYAQVTSSYQPESGYFIIDPNYPLSTSLTYKPYIS